MDSASRQKNTIMAILARRLASSKSPWLYLLTDIADMMIVATLKMLQQHTVITMDSISQTSPLFGGLTWGFGIVSVALRSRRQRRSIAGAGALLFRYGLGRLHRGGLIPGVLF